MVATFILIVILLGFMLALVIFETNARRPKVDRRTLREAERTLLEIQNNTTDIYAAGKASAAADKIREALDRQDPIR